MGEEELMKWVAIVAFTGGGIILIRWILERIREKSEPEPVDKEDVIIPLERDNDASRPRFSGKTLR